MCQILVANPCLLALGSLAVQLETKRGFRIPWPWLTPMGDCSRWQFGSSQKRDVVFCGFAGLQLTRVWWWLTLTGGCSRLDRRPMRVLGGLHGEMPRTHGIERPCVEQRRMAASLFTRHAACQQNMLALASTDSTATEWQHHHSKAGSRWQSNRGVDVVLDGIVLGPDV